MILTTPVPAHALFGIFGDSEEIVKATDGQIVVDAGKLAQNSSRHYNYQEGAAKVRFFLVRDNQGIVRAALDACEVCWREGKGYVMKNGTMFCSNCGRTFALNRIGNVTGGCNPHPIKFELKDNTVIISVQELLNGVSYFPEKRK
jgi:uncharacterized membrane protein